MLGSRKGHGVSEATRQKIRDKLKGRKISEEARRKRIGRKLSPEHRRKIGLAGKGRKLSEATKRKIRGRKLSEDTKRKLSEGKKGEKNPMYGKRLSLGKPDLFCTMLERIFPPILSFDFPSCFPRTVLL